MVRGYDSPTFAVYSLPGTSGGSGVFGHWIVTVYGKTRLVDYGDSLVQGVMYDNEREVFHRKIDGALFPSSPFYEWWPEGYVMLDDPDQPKFGEFYFQGSRDIIGHVRSSYRGFPNIHAHRQGNFYWISVPANNGYWLVGSEVVSDDSRNLGAVRCRVENTLARKYASRTDPQFFSDLSQSTAIVDAYPSLTFTVPRDTPRDAYSWARQSLKAMCSVPRYDTSEVIARAVEKIGAGVPNFYESMPGLMGIQSQISDTVSAFGKILARTAGPKDLAGQYLSYLYGYRQLPDEVTAVMDELRRLSTAGDSIRRVLRAGGSDTVKIGSYEVARSAFAKIAFSPLDNPLANWYRSTIDSGWAPTASNWWETVPFSFVVDWFTNIGDYLSHASTMGRWSTYRVHSLCASNKWVGHARLDGNGAFGFLFDTHYSRTVEASLPEYDFSFLSALSPQRHAVEAAALLVVNH